MLTFLRILAVLAILGVVALALLVFWPAGLTEPRELALTDEAMLMPEVDEAAYPRLATVAADCSACHTAEEGKPFAGGRPFPTPMGVVYSSNITPDDETGIGHYTLDEFRAALVDGVREDGAHLYPAMPYANYRKLSERDIEAIYRYVMEEVEPVSSPNRANEMTFPFNQRFGVRMWKWLSLPDPGFDAPDDPILARGAYLVEGPGHCGACHTPRNALYVQQGYGADDPDFLAGGKLNGWPVPSLRGKDGAPARWSEEELAFFLRTGRNAETAVTGEMTLVVEHSLQHLPDSDIGAMVAYLRHIAPGGGGQPGPAPDPDTIRATALWNDAGPDTSQAMLSAADPDTLDLGARLYLDNCSGCHFEDGRGSDRVVPELDGNPMINAESPTGLVHTILEGARLPSTREAPYPIEMPAFSDRLSDEEVAALATFVRGAWSNSAGPVDAGAVEDQR